ncbi:hypothetical protein K227x_01570 [Rubripirellula lacrimiformis]|uniref:Uncharacterized protein n=2 Tax=Rubripirellula lacrimiformis TaxID=1930273 RepID=A0A517N3S0_9BACT|nr:hypothetical protein K227x_01570 [Rubripirellula lacrimiformis]
MFGILALVALAVGAIGWLWITVTAFSDGDMLWGIGCLVLSPLCLVYGFLNLDELKVPLAMVVGGGVSQVAIGILGAVLS